jgi:hypothetical protein
MCIKQNKKDSRIVSGSRIVSASYKIKLFWANRLNKSSM